MAYPRNPNAAVSSVQLFGKAYDIQELAARPAIRLTSFFSDAVAILDSKASAQGHALTKLPWTVAVRDAEGEVVYRKVIDDRDFIEVPDPSTGSVIRQANPNKGKPKLDANGTPEMKEERQINVPFISGMLKELSSFLDERWDELVRFFDAALVAPGDQAESLVDQLSDRLLMGEALDLLIAIIKTNVRKDSSLGKVWEAQMNSDEASASTPSPMVPQPTPSSAPPVQPGIPGPALQPSAN